MHSSLYGAGYHCLPLGPAVSLFRVVIGNIEKPREYADELGLRNERICQGDLEAAKKRGTCQDQHSTDGCCRLE